MKLAINLATRGRPALLKDTLERTLANMRQESTRLLVSIDDDDVTTLTRFRELPNDDRVRYSILPREDSLGAKYNRILGTPADVYLAMVDYAPHITPDFDTKILDAAASFPDGIGVVYNRLANLSFPEINAVTTKLAQKMGFFYPPHFPYWFIDHWLDDIARMIDRIAYANVKIDTTKRPGTMDRREPAFWATFFDATSAIRRKTAFDIIGSKDFQEPAWRKKLLLRNAPLIDQRSIMVNNNVRGIAAEWGKAAPPEAVDDRYKRVKAAAITMLKKTLPTLEADEATQKRAA